MKDIKDIKELMARDIEQNNQMILDSLSSEVELINQIGGYLINSGGKRLRPLLVMLFAKAMNYNGNEHYQLATIIEFIHSATLLHDDVVDKSDMRRGRKTANNIFGNTASVLTGDFLYSKSFQLMVDLNKMPVMRVLADATNKISEGEVLQLLNTRNIKLCYDEYLNVIYCKTAKLFEAACELAGIISLDENNLQEYKQNLINYGVYLGNAFQIADDVLDYTANLEELGKNIGDDLDEGKMTLPIIYTFANGSDEIKETLKNAIELNNYDLENIIHIVKTSGAIEYSLQEAYSFADKAKKSIAFLPANKYKQALELICDLAVKRKS